MKTKFMLALVAALFTIVPSAFALSEQTKADYTAAYYNAEQRCGEKPGQNIRAQKEEPSSRRYHLHTKKLNAKCRPQPKPVVQTPVRSPVPQPAPAQPAAQPKAQSQPAPQSGGGAGGDLASIRQCESGGNYSTNTGNGYYGAYQFDQQTWRAAGGSGMPHTASPREQDAVARSWIRKGNRGAWPNC